MPSTVVRIDIPLGVVVGSMLGEGAAVDTGSQLFGATTAPSNPDTPSPERPKRPAISDLVPGQYGVQSPEPVRDEASSAEPIKDRVIVVSKLKRDDMDWIYDELTEYHYSVLDLECTAYDPKLTSGPGREGNIYIRYLINHYHTLPSTIVFVHSHHDYRSSAWHAEVANSDIRNVRNLQDSYVEWSGYTSLRCDSSPGCPDEIRPYREPRDSTRQAEVAFPDVWRDFFNNTEVPDIIAAPCCSQFAVSRDQVHRRPKSDYVWYHRWLMETDLPDDVSRKVMEYMWHVIFGQGPIYCPAIEQCFYDLYGLTT
ncbi:hypothetical protein BJX99DRAFT_246825 [Aspergillus californicus]